jgi:hypothetical protein
VRLQIDAGVQGVHFDEAEVPLTSLQYGGCFCPTCMRGFREYLQGLPEDERPEDVRKDDLSTFHYGEWLRSRGFDFKGNYASTPLFYDYTAFQQRNVMRYFGELADYARGYGASAGRDVQVSGNFFNLFEHYYALEPFVDVVVTEMRNTLWRQPEWYRHAAGFGRGKPVVVVENPYGGVVPEMVEALKRGRMYDRFRQSLYEAAAMGVNMSVPYGSWMGSVAEDAFYPPHDLATEIQSFIAGHEDLYGPDPTWAEIGVIYGITSNARARSVVELPTDNRLNVLPEGDVLAFDQIGRVLCAVAQPYDVVFFPDGELRADTLEADELARYRTLIVPGCDVLTPRQAELLESYVDAGGALVVVGDLGRSLGDRMAPLVERPDVKRADAFRFELGLLPDGPQVRVLEGSSDVALTLQRVDRGCALHFIRYDYDEVADRVPRLDRLVLELRLPFPTEGVTAFSPSGDLVAAGERVGDEVVRLTLREVPLYGIVLIPARS